MAAVKIYRRLQDLRDVDPNGLPDQGIPVYETSVSSFVVQTVAGGTGGGSFSLGLSNLGNTAGNTGVTGTRVVLAGLGAVSLSQITDGNGGTISISAPAQTAAFSFGVSGGNTAGDTGATGTRVVLAGGNNITVSQSTNANGASITISGPATHAEQTGISSIVASDATYTSGSVQFTGSGIVTIRSSANQRVVVDASQSAQTQNLHNITLSGNTAGALAQVSSGTLTLAGGNNITLSQAGNAITISGANAGGAQTGISGIANSQTTYTSGTVSLSELGAITIRSTTGNQFQLSVNPQSVQPETQTFIGGISASDTLYTSGTVRFTGVGGGVTVSSNTGQRVDISVAAPVAQTNQTVGLYAVGNTTGQSSSTTRDARSISVDGAGIVSVGYSGGTLRISATQSVQPETQTFIAGISASDTLYTSGNVRFTGVGGGITVSSNTGQRVDLSVAAQSVQPGVQHFVVSNTTFSSGTVSISGFGDVTVNTAANIIRISGATQTAESQSIGMSNLGNTSGTTGIASGAQVRFLLAGGNNVTLSQSLNGASGTITISAAAQTVQTQGILSAGVSTGGNTAGNTQVSTGSRLVIVGSGMVTASQGTAAGASTITLNATQSVQSLGMYAVQNTTGQSSSTTMDARTLSIAGDGAISVGYSAGSLRISAATQTVQTQNRFNLTLSGNTSGVMAQVSSGTLTLAGGNNITLSQNGNAITISGANIGGAQTGISGIANSETTYTSGSVTFSELGAITIRSTTGQRFQFSVDPQSVQTVGLYAVGNTTGQSSSTTRDARSISVDGAGAVSVGYSGGTLRISAPVQTAQTGISGIANSQTTYTSGTVSLSELGAITIRSTTGNQFQFSVNSQTVQTQNLHNVTLSGNTAGAMAQISSGTWTLAGGANITLSQAGNAVTISGGGSASDTDVSDIAQTAHGLAVGDWVRLDGTDYVLAQADTAENAEVVGVVSAVADANNFTLTTGGRVTGLSGLTAGTVYYLSPSSAGDITDTEPTGDGEISKPVLIARSTTSGYVFNMRGYAVQTTPPYLAGLSNVGNTSGDTGITGSRLVLAGGNNITLSQSTNASGGTVTISAFNQSVDTLGLYAVGNTTGQSSSTTRDARSISFDGAGAASVGFSGGTLRISVPTQTTQPGVQHFVVSNTTFSSGTVSISGFGDVTVNTAANIIRISAPAQTGTQFSAGVSGGNTSGHSGTVAGRLVLAGGNNITLSGSTNGDSMSVTISGGAAGGGNFSAGVSTGGNTAGATGVSGTQMVLVGSGVMSLSQTTGANGNTVSILGPAASVISAVAPLSTSTNGSTISILAPAQLSVGMSTAGNTSGDTGFVTGRLALVGGNNVTLSGSTNAGSQTLTISAASQTVQTQNRFNLTLSGNTAGALAHVSSGTLTLAGGSNVTLSQAGNVVTIHANDTDATSITQTTHGFSVGDWLRLDGTDYELAQADSQANAEVVGVVGTVVDANTFILITGGLVTGLAGLTPGAVYYLSDSSAGDITDTEPTADGSISKPVLIARNATSGYLINMRGNVIATGALNAYLAGVSNVGNTVGDTGITGSRLVLAGGANITLSQSTNASGGTVTISGGAGGGGSFSAGVSNIGNTAGDTGVTGTRLVLAGTNGITLSQSTNANGGTVTISGITQSAESQSIGMSNLGNTSGTTGIASGAQVRFLFAGGNNITLSQSINGASGTITISAPNALAQTDQTLGLYAVGNTTGQSSSTTRDARSVSVDGAGIISVGYSGGTLRISAVESVQTQGILSAGVSNVGNTAGNTQVSTGSRLVLAGAGAATLSQATAAGASTISISVPTQTVQTQGILSAGVSNVGNTAGNTQVSTGSRLVIAGAGIITASQATAAGASTISLSASQSAQTLGMYAVQNTTGQSSSTTMDARTLSVAGDGAASVGYSAGSLRISVPVQTVESQSIGMSNVGNTSGTTGMASGGQVRFVFAGGNNITLSQSLNGASGTITISAPNLGAGAMSAGVSNLGNTAGATGITGTQLVLVGSDNITLSQTTGANGGTVSIFGPAAGGFSAGVSTGGNTAGDTGVSGTRMVLVGVSPLSLSQATAAAGNTVSINAPATSSLVGVSGISLSTNGSTVSVFQTSGGPFVQEFNPYGSAAQTNAVHGQGILHIQPMQVQPDLRMDRVLLGQWISNASNSSGSITLTQIIGIYTRNASTLSLISSVSTSTNFSGSGTVGSYSLYGGRRWLSVPLTMTLSQGDYYMAIAHRTTTGGAAGHTVQQILMTQQSNATFSGWSGLLGAATNATMQHILGMGTYSASTATPPASIGLTQINGTGTLAMMPPIYQLRSGTV